jgi:methylated-DNA-[protein]-cysteine S-methyltransferase
MFGGGRTQIAARGTYKAEKDGVAMTASKSNEIARALRAGSAGTAAARRAQATESAEAARRFTDRAAQEGLADVVYASVDSPLGTLLAARTRKGLVRLAFPEESVDSVLETIAERLSPRIVSAPASLDPLRRELDEYFSGRRRDFQTPLDWSLIGPFGRRVLRATAAIPYGDYLSYGEVAAEAGSPRGFRAAGNALGANPIPVVIPCHRVLRSGGVLGNYGGGPERKRWLLELEGALPAQLG